MSPWTLDTRWFDLSLLLGIYTLGAIAFGRFEEHKPRPRRMLKAVLVTAGFAVVLEAGGRPWAWGIIGAMALGALLIHAWWLPRHGVNGWTAEPRDRYLELIGRR